MTGKRRDRRDNFYGIVSGRNDETKIVSSLNKKIDQIQNIFQSFSNSDRELISIDNFYGVN